MKLIRSFALAVTLALALACVGFTASDPEGYIVGGTASEVTSVWGLSFGDSWAMTNQAVKTRYGGTLLCEYVPQKGGHIGLYAATFFEREALLTLRFTNDKLDLIRFAFTRPAYMDKQDSDLTRADREERLRIQVRGTYYDQFLKMLTRKYGEPVTTEAHGEKTAVWKVGSQVIRLCEAKSETRHDTVLTYEDKSHRYLWH